ncbi:hypothetical protein [Clostridium vincentii]|uniref:Uncharacterized protein n=1 Tax=Clostridium vincentii TaxID=52704 RepID=A0A2T0BH83_9CLOT|nr:hypothetical protein [Clostridium vincentii]PRR83234.1 hypothetical protein CLVI_10330 [Clostridium vincentii]
MLDINAFLENSKRLDNSINDDVLTELSNEEVDMIMAVGNSIEGGKWFLNEDMNYLINKNMI